jgi:hypothetical protein
MVVCAASVGLTACGGGGSSGSHMASADALARKAQQEGLGCSDFKLAASNSSNAQYGTCTLTANLDEQKCQRARKLNVAQQQSALGTSCGQSGENASFGVFTAKTASASLAYYQNLVCRTQNNTGDVYYVAKGKNWLVTTSNAALGIAVADKLGGETGRPSC